MITTAASLVVSLITSIGAAVALEPDEPAMRTLLALVGPLPSDQVSGALQLVGVVEPSEGADESVAAYQVPSESFEQVDGYFELVLDPASLPEGVLDDTGVARFTITAIDEAGSMWRTTGSARAIYVADSGQLLWLDFATSEQYRRPDGSNPPKGPQYPYVWQIDQITHDVYRQGPYLSDTPAADDPFATVEDPPNVPPMPNPNVPDPNVPDPNVPDPNVPNLPNVPDPNVPNPHVPNIPDAPEAPNPPVESAG